MANDDFDSVLQSWKQAMGVAFERALPGQTLRPPQPSQTLAQTTAPQIPPNEAPNTPHDASVAQPSTPKLDAGSLAQSSESYSSWHEYQLGEVVGEGGMGQVFRAEQPALRREVAIKKLHEALGDAPDGGLIEASLSTADRQAAFVSEARVTGYLDHPNIVPVYALGQDQARRWFLSMKLVRGISWKYLLHPGQALEREKQNEARARNLSVDDAKDRAAHLEANLRLLLTVSNAVAFAHSKQIIHRDLKPENVMVGAFGEVLVMDWGLAVDVSETPDPAQARVPHKTSTGMGGTADYMAPEQTYGRGAGLSARTDVFLLGAILHELLTGKAPNAAGELQQALFKALRCEAPVFDAQVPKELANACRKALAKDPAARHASVLEFQQALEGYLTHRDSLALSEKAQAEASVGAIPNLARAVVLFEQALALWPGNAAARDGGTQAKAALEQKEQAARRNRSALRAAVAAIVIGLTAGFFWIRSEQARTEAQRVLAVANEAKAKEEAQRADENADHERKERTRADANAEQERRERNRAEKAETNATRQRDLAEEAFNGLVFEVQKKMQGQPALQDLKTNLLTLAVEGLQKVADANDPNAPPNLATAAALVKLGELSMELGQTPKAQAYYEKAAAFANTLVKENPKDTKALQLYGYCLEHWGFALLETGQTGAAREYFEKSAEISREIVRSTPNVTEMGNLAVAMQNLAEAESKLGRTMQAIDYAGRALDIYAKLLEQFPENEKLLQDAGATYGELGELFLACGQLDAALSCADKMALCLNALYKRHPKDSGIFRACIVAQSHRAHALFALRRNTEAQALFEKILDGYSKLAEADPRNENLQRDMASACYELGDFHMELQHAEPAQQYFERYLKLSERLAQTDPNNSIAQTHLATAYERSAELQLRLGQTSKAAEYLGKNLDICAKLAQADPDGYSAQHNLASAYFAAADILVRMARQNEAEFAYQKGGEILAKLAQAAPENTRAQFELCVSYEKLGGMLSAKGDSDGARKAFTRELELATKILEKTPEYNLAATQQAIAHENLGELDQAQKQPDAALAHFEEFKACYERLLKASPDDAGLKRSLAVGCEKIGDVLRQNEKPEEARAEQQRALEIREHLLEATKTAEARRDLAISYEKVSDIEIDAGHKKEGLALARKSLELFKQLAQTDAQDAEAQWDLVLAYKHIYKFEPGAYPYVKEVQALAEKHATLNTLSPAQKNSLQKFIEIIQIQ